MRAGASFLLIGAAAAGIVGVVACSSFDSDGGGGPSADGGDDAIVLADGAATIDAGADALVPCASTAPLAETFLSAGGAVTSLTTDGAYVYWVLGAKVIQRASATVPALEVIHSDVGQLSAIAVVPGYVAFASTGTFSVANVVDAGPGTQLSGDPMKPMIASEGAVVGHGTIYIQAVEPPAPGGTVLVAESNPSGIAVNAQSVFYTAAAGDAGPGRAVYAVRNSRDNYQTPTMIFHATGTDPSKIAADATELFVVDVAAELLFKIPTAGGAPAALATAQPDLGNVAVRGDYVYYTTSAGLRRVPKAGGCWTALSNDPVQEFTLTSQHVYFVKGTDIVRVKL
jgi:hypothetical protein